MSEPKADEVEAEQHARPLYQTITGEMLQGLDFEQVVRGSPSADCREYETAYLKAANEALAGNDPAAPVYAALAALCGFHFRPEDVSDPYGPMYEMDGRRSAIPDDFRLIRDVIAQMAELVRDSTLKARLADVAWMLNRRRVDLGLTAISAYCQIVCDVWADTRRFRFEKSNSPFSAQACQLLKRALSLAAMKTVGLGKPEAAKAHDLVAGLFRASITSTSMRDVQRLATLSLHYKLVPPAEVAQGIEEWLHARNTEDSHDQLDLLRLTASAYREAGSLPDHYRCRTEVVQAQVRMAEQAASGSAIMAASLLADAIAELHGIPDVKEMRLDLRHRLVDVQSNILEEMGSFSQELDLSEIIAECEATFENLPLRDMLFAFAAMSHSPSPDDLRAEAIKGIQEHPLSSIFAASHHDRNGKVSFRAPGVNLMSDPTDEALRPTIAQAEKLRRHIFAVGDIQTARRLINEQYYLTDSTFATLLNYSGFVPEELIGTYSRGFRRFFQGDPVSGLYILTPLLEASIRHVMKGRGHDVSTFDASDKTQQDITISRMFEAMRPDLIAAFGDAVVTDIENVFLCQPGPTIRHEVAHGLMNDGGPFGPDAAYACWLIFRLCLIPLFPHRIEFDKDLWR